MDRERVLALVLGGGVISSFVMGFVAGRVSAPNTEGPARSTASLESRARAGEEANSGQTRPNLPVLPKSAWAKQGEQSRANSSDLGLNPDGSGNLKEVPWTETLARFRAAGEMPDNAEAVEAASEAAMGLSARLSHDRAALIDALQRVRQCVDANEAAHLAAVLGRFYDPEVEQGADELARRGASPALRAAGFDLYDALDSPKAIDAALAALRQEREPIVRRAALRALPEPQGRGLDQAAEVIAILQLALREDRDPESRRQAAINLARWHRSAEDLQVLTTVLINDSEVNVRAGAAYALELAGSRSTFIVEALAQSLERAEEDPLVRENAWRALSASGPLPARAQAAWENFRLELDALGLGEAQGG